MGDGRGWFGDSDGHRDAALKANERWIETKWRRFKERLSILVPGGE